MHAEWGGLAELLRAAGALALERFDRPHVETKADGSPVTDADRVVEELIVERLARWFPQDTIHSEEGGEVSGSSDATWYVDPIDGTSSFVGRLADWGPTVCRVVGDRLEVGALYLPRLGELWLAGHDQGAYRGESRLPQALDDREVSREDVMFVPSRFHRAPRVPWPGKVRALGSTAVHLAHVAAGGGLAAVVPSWSLWDVGCGALLLRETGRVIWGPTGEPLRPESVRQRTPLLAGAPAALRLLLADGEARAALERFREPKP